MRLWSQQLLPYLDRQRLLSQHRECCALRGKGWGKKHSVVDYVFTHSPNYLVAYHYEVMNEMKRRGYNPDPVWYNSDWRGSTLGEQKGWTNPKEIGSIVIRTTTTNTPIYHREHNNDYLRECINLLKEKGADTDCMEVALAYHFI